MIVEPTDDAFPVIGRVCGRPGAFPVVLTIVGRVRDLLPKPPETNEHCVALPGWHRAVDAALHDEERRLDAIEIRDRRVLDVPVAVLPRRAAHESLAGLRPPDTERAAVGVHLAI